MYLLSTLKRRRACFNQLGQDWVKWKRQDHLPQQPHWGTGQLLPSWWTWPSSPLLLPSWPHCCSLPCSWPSSSLLLQFSSFLFPPSLPFSFTPICKQRDLPHVISHHQIKHKAICPETWQAPPLPQILFPSLPPLTNPFPPFPPLSNPSFSFLPFSPLSSSLNPPDPGHRQFPRRSICKKNVNATLFLSLWAAFNTLFWFALMKLIVGLTNKRAMINFLLTLEPLYRLETHQWVVFTKQGKTDDHSVERGRVAQIRSDWSSALMNRWSIIFKTLKLIETDIKWH